MQNNKLVHSPTNFCEYFKYFMTEILNKEPCEQCQLCGQSLVNIQLFTSNIILNKRSLKSRVTKPTKELITQESLMLLKNYVVKYVILKISSKCKCYPPI